MSLKSYKHIHDLLINISFNNLYFSRISTLALEYKNISGEIWIYVRYCVRNTYQFQSYELLLITINEAYMIIYFYVDIKRTMDQL